MKPLPPELFVVRGTNAEMRWDAVTSEDPVIQNDRFFVRNHTSTPSIDPRDVAVAESGTGVRWPLDLGYDDLLALRRAPRPR